MAKKYPEKDQKEILQDALNNTHDEQGKWFATAKQLGMLDLAEELALRFPVDPKTLNRAARDHLDDNPEFALSFAMASLHWLSRGWGYEITALDVSSAYSMTMEAGRKVGRVEETKEIAFDIIEDDRSPGMFIKQVLGRYTSK